MWLLNAKDYSLKHFFDRNAVKQGYAILSHTWGDDEVTFQDIKDLPKAKKLQGFQKILYTCQQAIDDGLHWVWVDTCCIDKSSSAELSEAINSMYRWYRRADVCYAYLADVDGSRSEVSVRDAMVSSRWMTRGWTLQELIAPKDMVFFGAGWHRLGTKRELAHQLAWITGVDLPILRDSLLLPEACSARKMSWAADRFTTRPEDCAYSLLGIFNVNMPLLYGEGGPRAFVRLQREIMQMSRDHSIFLHAKRGVYDFSVSGLFADRPEDFAHCGTITFCSAFEAQNFELTGASVRIDLPVIRKEDRTLAIVNCRYEDNFSGPIALRVREVMSKESTSPSADRSTSILPLRPNNTLIHNCRFDIASLDDLSAAKLDSLLILNHSQRFQTESRQDTTLHWPTFLFQPSTDFLSPSISGWPQHAWKPATNVMQWPRNTIADNDEDLQIEVTGSTTWRVASQVDGLTEIVIILKAALRPPSFHYGVSCIVKNEQTSKNNIVEEEDLAFQDEHLFWIDKTTRESGPRLFQDGLGPIVRIESAIQDIMGTDVCVVGISLSKDDVALPGPPEGREIRIRFPQSQGTSG